MRRGSSPSGQGPGGAESDTFGPDVLLRVLETFPVPTRYRVALSGGPDSLALLHAMGRLRPRLHAPVSAVHVNHGLHSDADEWQTACAGQCATLTLPFEAVSVDARPQRGESPEAAARRARYAGLAVRMEPGDMILTAHHRDDQAETLMLQLLRGAGPRGLAAMPAVVPFNGGWIGRPLLDVPRAAIEAYLAVHGQVPVVDPTNADPRFDRNFLRHRVMPLIESRWPAAGRTLARAARHQATAADALDARARSDLAGLLDEADGTLSCGDLSALPVERRAAVLREWLGRHGLPLPGTVHLEHILGDVLGSAPDRVPLVRWPGGEVRRYRGRLHAMFPLAERVAIERQWHLAAPLELPGGRLTARRVSGRGLAVRCCPDAVVVVRSREGGERLRPAGDSHTRSLKKLLQARGVPPWRRARLPLVFVGGALAAVPGICVGDAHEAAPDEPGWDIHWEETAAPVAGAGPCGEQT